MRTFNDIPSVYRVRLQGTYNPSVYMCPVCDYNPHKVRLTSHYDNIVGFAESDHGVMQVCECPVCSEKWYCHARLRRSEQDKDTYDWFMWSVTEGTNKHHKV